MGVGTSLGQSYDDEFHWSQSQWDSKYDTNQPSGAFDPPVDPKAEGITIRPIVDPNDRTSEFNTQLSPSEQQDYDTKFKLGDSYDYDMQGWYKANPGVEPNTEGVHYPDTFKKPNHPTFSDQSQYSSPETPGGQWEQQQNGSYNFTPSATNYKYRSPEELQQYFNKVEPNNKLVLPPTPYGLNPPERETPFPRPRLSEMVKGVYDTAKNASQFIQSNPWETDPVTGETHTSIQAIEKAADLAGMMTFGPAPVAKGMADGTLGSFMGVRSNTWSTKNMDKAIQMEVLDGANLNEIWKEAGMFRGADKQWRAEISDKNAKIKNVDRIISQDNFADLPPLDTKTPKGWGSVEGMPVEDKISIKQGGSKLGDILDHPELFEAYPHLKDTKVYRMPPTMDRDILGLNTHQGLFMQSMPEAKFKSVLLHEVQHDIQRFEGHARGGDMREFISPIIKTAEEQLPRIEKQFATNNKISPLDLRNYKFVVEMAEKGKTTSTKYLKEIKEKGIYEDIKNILIIEKNIKEAQLKAYASYRRFMGEVEANNVINRINMSKLERELKHPIVDEDFPRSEQIHAHQDTPLPEREGGF